MKQELLEYLIRHVTREVLKQTGKKPPVATNTEFEKTREKEMAILKNAQELSSKYYVDRIVARKNKKVNEQDEEEKGEFAKETDTKGAASPPDDGQGSADVPEIPKQKDTSTASEEPSNPETPTPPPSADLKGVVFVNPKDKAKLQKIKVTGMDDATLERNLHRLIATIAGTSAKVALSTIRSVKDAIKNPDISIYLYLGKYDPNSDEVFLMADKSLQVAKDASIQPTEMSGGVSSQIPTSQFDPLTSDDKEFARHSQLAGQTPAYGIDESLVKKIKSIVNEILNKQ